MKTKVQDPSQKGRLIPVGDLTEQQLSTLAAIGQGWVQHSRYYWKDSNGVTVIDGKDYGPCNNGGQAMELVEKYCIDLELMAGDVWSAELYDEGGPYLHPYTTGYAENPKLAAVRAFVASKFGYEMDYEAIVGGVE